MKGRVMMVTGASDGIGGATARRLASEGAHVVMIARRADHLEEAAEAIHRDGGSVETHCLDVADTDGLDQLIVDTAARHGRLDGLVNNAARSSMGAVVDASDSEWCDAFAVNAHAPFVATRAALRVMTRQKAGSIVNIASTNGRRAMKNMAVYSATKAALIQFSKVAAMEAAPHGVRVNALAPGMVMTPSNTNFFREMPDILAQVVATIPAGRAAQPEEIAGAIRFLLSDDSTFVNGICLDVDGGKAAQLYMPG